MSHNVAHTQTIMSHNVTHTRTSEVSEILAAPCYAQVTSNRGSHFSCMTSLLGTSQEAREMLMRRHHLMLAHRPWKFLSLLHSCSLGSHREGSSAGLACKGRGVAWPPEKRLQRRVKNLLIERKKSSLSDRSRKFQSVLDPSEVFGLFFFILQLIPAVRLKTLIEWVVILQSA